MKWNIRDLMHRMTSIMEVIVGLLLLLALLSAGFGLIHNFSLAQFIENPNTFSALLSSVATLVLGVEFIRMLCTHTLDSVIEIMLLAIARQMLVEHTTPFENMMSVFSMAILYIVRKYLYIPKLDYVKPIPTISQMLFKRHNAEQPVEQESEKESKV